MRVLVTGGAGYVGSHTTKVLAHSGFQPVVLDNLETGHRWAARWGPLVVGDLANTSLLQELLQEYRVEAVLHFAAHAYVSESVFSRNSSKQLRLSSRQYWPLRTSHR